MNSICKEKGAEPGMRGVLLLGGAKELFPSGPLPPWARGRGHIHAMSHIYAMSGCAVSPTAAALAVELRSLWRAQLAAAGWAGRRDAQTTVRTILGGKDVILRPDPKFK